MAGPGAVVLITEEPIQAVEPINRGRTSLRRTNVWWLSFIRVVLAVIGSA
jgi:hypothetical protein